MKLLKTNTIKPPLSQHLAAIMGALFLGILIGASACENSNLDKVTKINVVETDTLQIDTVVHLSKPVSTDTFYLGMGYDFEGNGKDNSAIKREFVFTKELSDTLDFPIIDGNLVQALRQHLRLLELRKQESKQNIGNLNITLDELKATIEELLAWQYTKPTKLLDGLDAYQTWGEDKRGNVHFTGYFTPIIQVNKRKTKAYQYPLYARPKNWTAPWPSRQAIEEGALAGLDLELAYAKDKLDVYFMQVQGSGYVEYPNGKQKLFGYSGNNKHGYRSIGRYLVRNDVIAAKDISLVGIKRFFKRRPDLLDEVLNVNPSYTFFTIKNKQRPRGAGHVPLTTLYSVAADRKYFPLGSCLLAYVPILSPDGTLKQHEWRFLLAQDVGGAIKGAGHLDIYSGIGQSGQEQASALHHYGKVWLLLPKKR